MRPQASGWAWARLAARLSPTPPASTTVGHDRRPVTMPRCLSRWRSRAAMTQVRSMQTATAQDMGPVWPCRAAVSRMWVNDPAPAMTASAVTGSASATASRRRPAFTSRPAVRDGQTGRPRPGAARHRSCCAGPTVPPRCMPRSSRQIASCPDLAGGPAPPAERNPGVPGRAASSRRKQKSDLRRLFRLLRNWCRRGRSTRCRDSPKMPVLPPSCGAQALRQPGCAPAGVGTAAKWRKSGRLANPGATADTARACPGFWRNGARGRRYAVVPCGRRALTLPGYGQLAG